MEELNTPRFMTLDNAIGTIQAGPEQQERLDEITERLKGDEFYVATDQTIPSKCIDGRVGANGFAPNIAGGTEALMVADDLTLRRFAAGTTLEAYAGVINHMQAHDLPVGGHTDTAAREPKSGCGANDRLDEAYAFMAAHSPLLQELSGSLGVTVPASTQELIERNAAARTEFSLGSELLTVLETAVGTEGVDMLEGTHNEVVVVINKRAGTTLDRNKLQDEFGPSYEAFNVDVWSFPEAAAAIANSDEEIPALVAGMVEYTLAVAHILCGPNMRVIVRD